jgi:hypothetical protein
MESIFSTILPTSRIEGVYSKSFTILCAGVVVACFLTVGVAAGATIDPAKSTSIGTNTGIESAISDEPVLQYQQLNTSAPETDLRIDVRANGSAVWTVQYRFRLNSANETAAFGQLRADIASNPSPYRERFRQRMAGAVASAERTTGREMAIENVSVRTTRDGTTGIVTYEFVWRNFAASDGDRLRIGDALTGLSFDNGTQVMISWPDDYEATTVQPAPAERRPNAVIWVGPTEFTGSEPVVELIRSDSTTTGTGFGAEGGSNEAPASGNELPLWGIAIVALLLVVVGLLGIVFVQRRQTDGSAPAAVATDPTADQEISDETTAPTSTDNENPPETENDGRPPLDLLSNEEQVVEVLKRSGGRAKQQQIVETLGWTDTKTSSVVRELRENGTIDGFRLGRENVLRLPEEGNETDTDDTTNNE